ncbi:collagenase [Streptomyces sp. NPDC093094]|uniref:collagenase n=1 Tax=Streptomyces sp. NPDC093094 TaxID=3366026 RepID=UPI003812C675
MFLSRTPHSSRARRRGRRISLLAVTAALTAGLTGPPGTSHAAPGTPHAAPGTSHAAPGTSHAAPGTSHAAPPLRAAAVAPRPGHDHAEHLAEAPRPGARRLPAPGGGRADGLVPGPATAPPGAGTRTLAPCTLDGVTGLTPERFADFLTDPAVTADGCLRTLLWTWDGRLAPVMSDAHVQAVSRRAAALAPAHDGTGGTHLPELFTYLHAVSYHDFSRAEIDVTDAPTVAAMRRAVAALGAAARTFDPTRSNAETLREALYAACAPGLRRYQLPLVKRVLATMGPGRTTAQDTVWAGAALAALSLNYLGVYPGNRDTAFHDAVVADPSYRAAFRAFADHGHLKDRPNAWVVRDALGEYGRFGQIDRLRAETVTGLGTLLGTTARTFGDRSAPWAKTASWLIEFDACAPYRVCREDIERLLFPRTYTYDTDAHGDTLRVRTGLDRATVDRLYYASKQVKAQFHRILGTLEPLPGDTNRTLGTVLYASRADYETFHPLLTGMGTDNGGIYIERGATFYTYQRRVPQDSSLTLEELFRHEYTHYLNGRWAVPGLFGEGTWYQGDRTTAMDEGTAEFLAGATRDDGVRVRRSLVAGIVRDTADGGPRMTVDRILHATYDGDGFRFYPYAGTFFSYLWRERPALLREMYRQLRADAPAAFDTWRDRLGADTALQRDYDAFLDEQIAHVDDLYVPTTRHTPVADLGAATAAEARASFAAVTYATPECATGGSTDRPRFVCTGRITANLADAESADRVFADMAETVDLFLLERGSGGVNNLADMNCSFGEVTVWSTGRAGTADYRCEGPLRP